MRIASAIKKNLAPLAIKENKTNGIIGNLQKHAERVIAL